jgi:DNA primase
VLCGDSKISPSKKRFHLDYHNGEPGYHCFNCGAKGSFVKLYSIIMGMSIAEAKKEIYKYDPEQIKKALTEKPNGNGNGKKEYHIRSMDNILDECIGIDTEARGTIEPQYQKLLKKFIEERKIPKNFKIFVATSGRYKGRAIIPIYKDGHIVYFQGRALVNIEPKYLNPIVEKSGIIMNEEKFQRDKYVIVTEGLLDAMMIGDQGTSVLGADIDEYFVKKVGSMTDKGIIVVLDNDETGYEKLMGKKKGEGLLNQDYSNPLKFFIMPKKYSHIKDLNQLVSKTNIKNIYQFVVDNSYDKFACKVKLGLK